MKSFWNGLTRQAKAGVAFVVSLGAGVVLMGAHHSIEPTLFQALITAAFVWLIPNWESK